MKHISIILFLLLICCKSETKTEDKSENDNLSKEIISSKKASVQNLNSYCFFKLDDKYSTENDSVAIHNWLKEKSQAILKNDAIENIFNQKAGGPNGAQWNPSTDLYIAISTTSDEFSEPPKLYVNGKFYQKEPFEYNPSLIWYTLSHDFWTKEVKKIDSLDIKEMYPPELLEGVESGTYTLMADLKHGEILKFEISHREGKLINFFHAAYGE